MSTLVEWFRVGIGVLPWALPVFAGLMLVGGTLADRVSQRTGVSRNLVIALAAALSVILAITLTPLDVNQSALVINATPNVLPLGPRAIVSVTAADWWPVNDRTLNVVLFIPLGLAVACLPRRFLSRCAAGALLLPLLVEGFQWLIPALSRDPQWQDVVDNLAGVVFGLFLGAVTRILVRVGRGVRTSRLA